MKFECRHQHSVLRPYPGRRLLQLGLLPRARVILPHPQEVVGRRAVPHLPLSRRYPPEVVGRRDVPHLLPRRRRHRRRAVGTARWMSVSSCRCRRCSPAARPPSFRLG